MPLDLRLQFSKLDVYCRVVELQSLTKAAEELFLTQPVVTSHLQTLQSRLGVKLLFRDRNVMRPTEEGQIVYEWAKSTLESGEAMTQKLASHADGSQGKAAIAASMTVGSYLLPQALMAFREERPLARIELDMFVAGEVVRAIDSGSYDLGVLIAHPDSIPKAVEVERVGEEELVLVASPQTDLPDEIQVGSLSECQFVESVHDRFRTDLMSQLFESRGVALGPTALEVGHAEAAKRVVKSGFGVAFLYLSSVEDELQRGELRRIDVDRIGRLVAPIFLVRRPNGELSKLQTDLVSLIRETCGPV